MPTRARLLALLLVVVCAQVAIAQDTVDLSIDSFTLDSPLIAIITSGGEEEYSSYATGNPKDIMGAERDLFLFISTFTHPNLYFHVEVYDGYFGLATPPADETFLALAQMTWDGPDRSVDVNPRGLGGINFGGPDSAIMFSYKVSEAFSFTLEVYSGSSYSYCEAPIVVPASREFTPYSVPLSSFSMVQGGCDFSDVGAVNVIFPLKNHTDFEADYFRVGTPTCEVSLYTGGDECTPIEENVCVSCYDGVAEHSFLVECSQPLDSVCTCTQQEFSSSDCSGSSTDSAVQNLSCSDISGMMPAGTVCLPIASVEEEVGTTYFVNLFQSDPSPTCAPLSGNTTCMACSAGGLTNYYTPTCTVGADPPCILSVYADSSCSAAPVLFPMNDLSCDDLYDMYEGQTACGFSYKEQYS